MRRRTRRTIGSVVVILIAVGAAAGIVWWYRVPLLNQLPTPPIVLTEADYGRVVNVLQGQTIEVRLRGNRLSGYNWYLGMPVPFLQQTEQPTFKEDWSPATPGDGYQSMSFRAVKPGTGPLYMGYLLSSNTNADQPRKSFRVVVIVR